MSSFAYNYNRKIFKCSRCEIPYCKSTGRCYICEVIICRRCIRFHLVNFHYKTSIDISHSALTHRIIRINNTNTESSNVHNHNSNINQNNINTFDFNKTEPNESNTNQINANIQHLQHLNKQNKQTFNHINNSLIHLTKAISFTSKHSKNYLNIAGIEKDKEKKISITTTLTKKRTHFSSKVINIFKITLNQAFINSSKNMPIMHSSKNSKSLNNSKSIINQEEDKDLKDLAPTSSRENLHKRMLMKKKSTETIKKSYDQEVHLEFCQSNNFISGIFHFNIFFDKEYYSLLNFERVKYSAKTFIIDSGELDNLYLVSHKKEISENNADHDTLYCLKQISKLIKEDNEKHHHYHSHNNKEVFRKIFNIYSLQAKMEHPHIMSIKNIINDEFNLNIITDYMSNSSLSSYIYTLSSKQLDENLAYLYFNQIASAVYFLHDNKVIHGDVCLENILLDVNMNAKLFNFKYMKDRAGRAESKAKEESDSIFKLGNFVRHTNHEVQEDIHIINEEHNVDIFGLGVLLYEILHQRKPLINVFITMGLYLKEDTKKRNKNNNCDIIGSNISPTLEMYNSDTNKSKFSNIVFRDDLSDDCKSLILYLLSTSTDNISNTFKYDFEHIFLNPWCYKLKEEKTIVNRNKTLIKEFKRTHIRQNRLERKSTKIDLDFNFKNIDIDNINDQDNNDDNANILDDKNEKETKHLNYIKQDITNKPKIFSDEHLYEVKGLVNNRDINNINSNNAIKKSSNTKIVSYDHENNLYNNHKSHNSNENEASDRDTFPNIKLQIKNSKTISNDQDTSKEKYAEKERTGLRHLASKGIKVPKAGIKVKFIKFSKELLDNAKKPDGKK